MYIDAPPLIQHCRLFKTIETAYRVLCMNRLQRINKKGNIWLIIKYAV